MSVTEESVVVEASAQADSVAGLTPADESAEKPVEEDKQGTPAKTERVQKTSSNGEGDDFVQLEMEQISSPFTKETVLKLNAIVGRSLAAIESFDEFRKANESKSDRDTLSLYLTELNQLAEKAEAANVDMESASSQLKSSGEKYNAPMLSAMVRFVENVEHEIKEEIKRVAAKVADTEKSS